MPDKQTIETPKALWSERRAAEKEYEQAVRDYGWSCRRRSGTDLALASALQPINRERFRGNVLNQRYDF